MAHQTISILIQKLRMIILHIIPVFRYKLREKLLMIHYGGNVLFTQSNIVLAVTLITGAEVRVIGQIMAGGTGFHGGHGDSRFLQFVTGITGEFILDMRLMREEPLSQLL